MLCSEVSSVLALGDARIRVRPCMCPALPEGVRRHARTGLERSGAGGRAETHACCALCGRCTGASRSGRSS